MLFVLAITVTLGAGIAAAASEWDYEGLMAAMFGILISLFVGVFAIPAALAVDAFALPATEQRTDEGVLLSVEESSAVNGRFTLGSGTISSEPVLIGYTKEHDDLLDRETVRLSTFYTSRTTVIETPDLPAGGPARWVRIDEVADHSWLAWPVDVQSSRWVLEVPEGTIQRSFDLGPATDEGAPR